MIINNIKKLEGIIFVYAVIMAGGEGTRLRPLTLDRPKPLVSVAGKPAIDRILSLLARHGIKKAAVTTMYLSSLIEEHCGGSREGVELFYFREDMPLGTAGSVKNTESLLSLDSDDSFIVISGDAVCDIDLSAAAEFHRSKDADVTIITSSAAEPYEYGVILCSDDGKIIRFIEKPGKTQAFADTVNTGIYIIKRSVLNLIPEKTMYDFGRDLFPYMLSHGYAMYGKKDSGYWCDVGDLHAYYACNIYTAKNENSITADGNVIGTGCHIAADADVRDCVLLDRVTIGGGSVVKGAILGDGATVGRNAVIGRGCTLGSGCVVGDNAKINTGIKLFNKVRIGNGACVMSDVFFGEIKADIFGDSGIVMERSSLSAEYAVRIGKAISAAVNNGSVGIMSEYNPVCRLVRESLLCGVCSAGGRGIDLSPDFGGFSSMAAFAAVRLGLDAALCVYEEGNKIKIDIFDRCGLYPERSFERKAAAVLAGGSVKHEPPTEPERISGLGMIYRSEIAREAGILRGFNVSLNDNVPAHFLAAALKDSGAIITGDSDLKLEISNDGLNIDAYENIGNDKFKTDKWHIAAFIEKSQLDGIRSLALPVHAPAPLKKIATDGGVTVAHYTSCPYDSGERDVRLTAAGQLWLRDALYMAANLCSLLSKSNNTLKNSISELPPFDSLSEDYMVANSGRQPRLSDIGTPAEEGVVIDYESGRVHVIPRRNGGFRLFVDTVNAEAASEIMSVTKKRLEEIMSVN